MFNSLNGLAGPFSNASMNLLNLNEAEHKYIVENYGKNADLLNNYNNLQNIEKNARKDKFVNNIKKKLAQKAQI